LGTSKKKDILSGGINMDYDKIRKRIIDIIADIAVDEDLSNIDDNIRLREQLDLDSMDFLSWK
jgi:acyl carrier protein